MASFKVNPLLARVTQISVVYGGGGDPSDEERDKVNPLPGKLKKGSNPQELT